MKRGPRTFLTRITDVAESTFALERWRWQIIFHSGHIEHSAAMKPLEEQTAGSHFPPGNTPIPLSPAGLEQATPLNLMKKSTLFFFCNLILPLIKLQPWFIFTFFSSFSIFLTYWHNYFVFSIKLVARFKSLNAPAAVLTQAVWKAAAVFSSCLCQ